MLMTLDRTRYLTIQEAAEKSGYDYEHLRKLVKSGTVASLEISEHSRLVDWPDLQRYLKDKPQRKPRPKGKKRGIGKTELVYVPFQD